MARTDSLRLLLIAEPPGRAEGVEIHIAAIVDRLDEYPPGSEAYADAHQRINELLDLRDRLAAAEALPGAG